VPHYLAVENDHWQPADLTATGQWRADLVVARDGSGTHNSVQSALDAVPSARISNRRYYILIMPGQYREQICVRDKAPVTLYAAQQNPAEVVIVHGHFNAELKQPGVEMANACVPGLQNSSYGTAGSATFAAFSDGFELVNLTVANNAMDHVRLGVGYPEHVGESGGAQAVALMTQGDRIQLENVHLRGHQDTFYVRASSSGPARVYAHNSVISGDVDFVFGDATLVVENSVILSRTGRRALGSGGHVLAPSTAADQKLGFLVTRSRFLAEVGITSGTISLGRAWDFGVARGEWKPAISPNGQAVIRDSVLGLHIGPWAASTSRRPFSAVGEQANRFAEYQNRSL
jgi:pectin methylesterase-like acyl-CoA thioesterase